MATMGRCAARRGVYVADRSSGRGPVHKRPAKKGSARMTAQRYATSSVALEPISARWKRPGYCPQAGRPPRGAGRVTGRRHLLAARPISGSTGRRVTSTNVPKAHGELARRQEERLEMTARLTHGARRGGLDPGARDQPAASCHRALCRECVRRLRSGDMEARRLLRCAEKSADQARARRRDHPTRARAAAQARPGARRMRRERAHRRGGAHRPRARRARRGRALRLGARARAADMALADPS